MKTNKQESDVDFGPEVAVTGQVHAATQLLLPGARDPLAVVTAAPLAAPGTTCCPWELAWQNALSELRTSASKTSRFLHRQRSGHGRSVFYFH